MMRMRKCQGKIHLSDRKHVRVKLRLSKSNGMGSHGWDILGETLFRNNNNPNHPHRYCIKMGSNYTKESSQPPITASLPPPTSPPAHPQFRLIITPPPIEISPRRSSTFSLSSFDLFKEQKFLRHGLGLERFNQTYNTKFPFVNIGNHPYQEYPLQK